MLYMYNMENVFIAKRVRREKNEFEKEKPEYEYVEKENYAKVNYKNVSFLLDLNGIFSIINKKTFYFRDENDTYPSFYENNKKIDYLQFLFGFSNVEGNGKYYFKNGNEKDLRKINVEYLHEIHESILQKHNKYILEYNKGHYSIGGVHANILKNPYWVVQDGEKKSILMYCEKNTICKLCPESYQKIKEFEEKITNGKKITWSKSNNGYIYGNIPVLGKHLLIHQVITSHYGHGKGTGGNNSNILSVDHIDRDPMNNTMENLRLATREEQEQNSRGIMPDTKRERQINAQELPEGIIQEMLPKYVIFYNEKKLDRQYFRIEKHPKMEKNWETTKSRNVSVQDKLNQAIEMIEKLKSETPIIIESHTRELPKYVTIIKKKDDKLFLNYDERHDGCRYTLKRILKDGYDLKTELILFNKDIHSKFNGKKLEGISLETISVNNTHDPDIESKQKIKFVKYLKITTDRGNRYLTYDERTTQNDKKVIFNIKIRLIDGYQLNDKLKELKKKIYEKYETEFPEKKFDIPDEI